MGENDNTQLRGKIKNLQLEIKKHGEPKLPMTRFSRMHPIYDLHEYGRWVAAPGHYCSQHPLYVKAQAGGLQTGGETNVPIQKCGSKRTHYEPSRKGT